MRILVCASEAPLPPVNGFRVMLRALYRKSDASTRSGCSPSAHRARKQRLKEDDLRLIPRPQGFGPAAILETARAAAPRPLRADRLGGPMAEPFSSELEAFEPDVVHVTSGRLAGLGRILAGRPAVLGALDAMHLNFEARALVARGFRKRLLRSEVGRVRRFEATEYKRFTHVTVVSEADRAALLEVDPSLEITVIPNGVDVAFFEPDPQPPSIRTGSSSRA